MVDNKDSSTQIAERMMIAELADKFETEFKLVGLQVPLVKGLIHMKEQEMVESIRDLVGVDSPKSLLSPEAALSLANVSGMVEILQYLITLSEDINGSEPEE